MNNKQDISGSDNVVRERIRFMEKGAIFFPSDFEDIASPEAVRQTLGRMVKRGEIMRVSRGIYCIPRSNEALGLDCIPPSTEDIAQRLAERDKVKIIPTGDHAGIVLANPCQCGIYHQRSKKKNQTLQWTEHNIQGKQRTTSV